MNLSIAISSNIYFIALKFYLIITSLYMLICKTDVCFLLNDVIKMILCLSRKLQLLIHISRQTVQIYLQLFTFEQIVWRFSASIAKKNTNFNSYV